MSDNELDAEHKKNLLPAKRKKKGAPKENPRAKEGKPLDPIRVKSKANPGEDDPIWKALDWNKAGGKHARDYPFVVSRYKTPCASTQDQIECLAGESGRLLRFMTEASAKKRAEVLNDATLFARSQISLF